jgi:ketosteroid isomerase-like protein
MTGDAGEIERLTYEYALRNDRFDVDGVMELWVDDCLFDMSELGMRRLEGFAAVRGYFEKERDALTHIMHVTTNHIIDVAGDEATGTAYFLAIAVTNQGNENQARGFYDDRYVRTADGWRFAVRRLRLLLPYRPVREARG